MRGPVDALIAALDVAPDSEHFRARLQSALGLAAGAARLRRPWIPQADDPRLLRRLATTLQSDAAAPDSADARARAHAFLVAECERATMALVRALQQSPSDNRIRSAWIEMEESRVRGWCALWVSINRDVLSRTRLSKDEVIRDLLQDVWLFLLDRGCHVIRQFRGTEVSSYRGFLRLSVMRHLRGLKRSDLAPSRLPPGGLTRAPGLAEAAAANDGPEVAEAAVELKALVAWFDAHRADSERLARDEQWLLRVALGESISAIARDEPDHSRTGISTALSSLRRRLAVVLGRGDEGDDR
mgnify:CR=1 FL=1